MTATAANADETTARGPAGGLGRTLGRSLSRRWTQAMPVIALMPAAILLLCSVSSDLVAMFGGNPLGLWDILPGGPVSGDWLSAEISSTAFLLLGIAVARRKRTGWKMALLVMAGAIVVQGSSLDHPVAATLAIGVAAILIATRSRYSVGSDPRDTKIAYGLVGAGVLLAIVGGIANANGFDAVSVAAAALGSLFDMATPVAVPGLAAVGAILVVARIAYLGATVMALDPAPDDRPASAVAAARRALRRVGAGSLLPYQLADECISYADEAGTAVVTSATVGRTSVVLGDPAGEPSAAARVFEAWVAHSRERDIVPVVYQASDGQRATLHASGWKSVLVGREAFVDPSAFDLTSPKVANLRHTITRSRKGGIRTIWSPSGVMGLTNPHILPGLIRLDEEWRKTAGPQLGFTVGRFDPHETGDTALTVAVDDHDVPVAFIVLRPTGADEGWMLDVMRRARGGVPGAVEACVATAIEALGELGVTRLSLGLAPLAGLDPSVGSLAERLLARGARLIRPLYDHEGLAFFKNKFNPVWEPRYLAVTAWGDLPTAVIALLRLHLGGAWPRVVRSVAAGFIPAR